MIRFQSVAAAVSLAVLALACGEDTAPPLGPAPGADISAATEVQRRAPGEFARAGFSSTDESGCVRTNVDVAALSRSGEELATVLIEQFNSCTFESFFAEADDVPATLFQVSGALSSARLQGTFQAFADPGGTAQIQVDLTWTGSGAREILAGGEVSLDPDNPSSCKFVFADETTLRQATATGTVVVSGVNYTPEPSVSGVLGRSNTSSIAIQC